MELMEQLKSVFKDGEIVTVYKNKVYDYTINILKPTKNQPYTLVFTDGLSQIPQAVSEKHEEFKYIELYFCLPDYWKIDENTAEFNWPIKWLNKLAELPQKNGSWFGPGDTIPAGNPPKALSEKLAQNHFILAEPMLFKNELTSVQNNNKSIKYLAVVPIYQKEVDYKLRNSAKVFMAKYQLNKHNELVDNYREPVVGKMKFKYMWLVAVTVLILIAVAYVLFTDGSWVHDANEISTPPLPNQ